jgi:serine/threonine protein kinase
LAENLLRVLDYLHQFEPPVLHRDIKPSNLILGEDGLVYLVDFGAVQNQAALTGVTFTVVGTCGYAPLEQFWGRAVPASDLYALGATLIHLLTGLAPVDLPQRNSRIEFAAAVPQLSPFFRSWLEKLTETALEKRFSSAKEALQVLRNRDLMPARSSRKLSQPDRSSIQLQRSPGALSIYLPPLTGWNCLNVLKLRDFAVGYFFLAFSVPFSKALAGIGLGYLWIFMFVMPMTGAYVYFLALQSCENTELLFEEDSLTITRRSFRFLKPDHKVISVDSIMSVFTQRISNRHHVILNVQGDENWNLDRHVIRRNMMHPAAIPESYYYDIGGWLSELEALWLMQEIQDWLGGRD